MVLYRPFAVNTTSTTESDSGVASPPPEWSEVEAVVGAWYRRAREAQFSHYEAANRCGACSRWFGVPAVILSALVGTSVFASLQTEVDVGLKILVGIISIFASVLSALQTFLGFSERAEKHRAAAASYGAVRRAIEQRQVLPPSSRKEADTFLASVRTQLDDIASATPDVPAGIWRRAQGAIAQTSRPEGFRTAARDGDR